MGQGQRFTLRTDNQQNPLKSFCHLAPGGITSAQEKHICFIHV